MKKKGYEKAFFGLTYSGADNSWIYLYGDSSSFLHGVSTVKEKRTKSHDRENNVEVDVHVNTGNWNDAQFGKETYTPNRRKYKDIYAYIYEWDE